MPANNEVVTVNVQDFIELLLRRMQDEQMAPLKDQLSSIEARTSQVERDVTLLKYAVMGNGAPSLAEKIQHVDDTHSETHKIIFARIEEVRKECSVVTPVDASRETEFNKWKWMFHGAWIAITGVVALIASLATIWKGFHHP